MVFHPRPHELEVDRRAVGSRMPGNQRRQGRATAPTELCLQPRSRLRNHPARRAESRIPRVAGSEHDFLILSWAEPQLRLPPQNQKKSNCENDVLPFIFLAPLPLSFSSFDYFRNCFVHILILAPPNPRSYARERIAETLRYIQRALQ